MPDLKEGLLLGILKPEDRPGIFTTREHFTRPEVPKLFIESTPLSMGKSFHEEIRKAIGQNPRRRVLYISPDDLQRGPGIRFENLQDSLESRPIDA